MKISSILNLYKLKRNLNLKASSLEEIQLIKLKLIVKHAYENVPFYHRQLKNVGIKPNDIKSIADLHKLPLTTKKQIQLTPIQDALAKNYNSKNYIIRTTSGSTGLNLTILVDKSTLNLEEAIWARALHNNGVRLRDKIAIITDPRHFSKNVLLEQLRIQRKKHISIFDNVEKQLATLKDFKPDVIRSYVSPIVLLAEVLKNETKDFEPRLIFTCAENLDEKNRQLISSGFNGSEVFDNYACSEFGLLAWECRLHEGYHINADALMMEFLKDGEEVASGESGEIVCTNLSNHAMPLIRYKLGDVGTKGEEQCSCGVTLPLMKVIEGRIDDFLRTLDGRLISPTIFFPYPFESMKRIRQFRVIQEKRNKLKIQLVAKDNYGFENQFFDTARKQIQNIFGTSMDVEFQLLKKIDLAANGKLRKTISKIDSQAVT